MKLVARPSVFLPQPASIGVGALVPRARPFAAARATEIDWRIGFIFDRL